MEFQIGIVILTFQKCSCACAHAQSLNRVQLCNSMDCSLPGSSVHGISPARILECVAIHSVCMSMQASLVVQMVKNSPTMQETPACSLGPGNPLEKELATHSNILAGEIPWTEEPGGLQSTGWQKS